MIYIDLSFCRKFINQQFDTVGVATIGALPNFTMNQVLQFSLNTEDVIIKEGTLGSGTLSLFFRIQATDLQYNAVLSTNEIHNASGNPMTLTLSNNQQQHTIDLSNYHITPNEEGNIVITAIIHVQTTTLVEVGQDLNYFCHLALTDVSIKNLRGQFKAIDMGTLEESIGFSLPLDKINLGKIGLNDATISIFARNSLCEFSGSIDELYLYNHQGTPAPFYLINNPVQVFCPRTPDQYTTTPITNGGTPISISHINYDPALDSIKFKCDLLVNPSGFAYGDIYVDDNSSLDLKINAELPANMSIENAVYNDTMDNALYESFNPSTIESIDKLTLRIAFTNAFPFDLIPSIDFLDSHTGDKYHVNLNGLQIHGAYGDIPFVQNPVFIEFTQEDAQKIINHDKIILNFHLNTQGHDVKIKTSQYVRAAIGAKVNYSNIHF